MNYQKIYDNLINKRVHEPAYGYTETHHILPRSLGGTNVKTNLVILNAREHFICHLLLTKIYEKDLVAYRKMTKAFFMMLVCKGINQERHISSKSYEFLRKKFSKTKSIEQTGAGNSQYGKKSYWVWHELFGKRRINRNLLEEYLSQGWFYGLCHKYEKIKVKNKKDFSYLNEWYQIYKNSGFKSFCEQTGYTKSKQNLVQLFSTYVKDFKPQNGKRRGDTIPS